MLDVFSLAISLINIEPPHNTYMDSHNTVLLGSDITTWNRKICSKLSSLSTVFIGCSFQYFRFTAKIPNSWSGATKCSEKFSAVLSVMSLLNAFVEHFDIKAENVSSWMASIIWIFLPEAIYQTIWSSSLSICIEEAHDEEIAVTQWQYREDFSVLFGWVLDILVYRRQLIPLK